MQTKEEPVVMVNGGGEKFVGPFAVQEYIEPYGVGAASKSWDLVDSKGEVADFFLRKKDAKLAAELLNSGQVTLEGMRSQIWHLGYDIKGF